MSAPSAAPVFPVVEPPATPVLLYDGDCGFCAGSVQLVLAQEPPERRTALRFAPLQGAYGRALRARHPVLDTTDSVLWHDPSRDEILVRSAAALAVCRHLGGGWALLAAVGALVPRPLRDWLYDQIARRRLALAAPACLLPTPDERRRFLP